MFFSPTKYVLVPVNVIADEFGAIIRRIFGCNSHILPGSKLKFNENGLLVINLAPCRNYIDSVNLTI
jgi:hypothetical protein